MTTAGPRLPRDRHHPFTSHSYGQSQQDVPPPARLKRCSLGCRGARTSLASARRERPAHRWEPFAARRRVDRALLPFVDVHARPGHALGRAALQETTAAWRGLCQWSWPASTGR